MKGAGEKNRCLLLNITLPNAVFQALNSD